MYDLSSFAPGIRFQNRLMHHFSLNCTEHGSDVKEAVGDGTDVIVAASVVPLLVLIILISTCILVGIFVGKRVAHPTVRIRKRLGLAAKSVHVESYTGGGPDDTLTQSNTLNSPRVKEDLENTLTNTFSDNKTQNTEQKDTPSPSKKFDSKSDKSNKVKKVTQQLLESSFGHEKVDDVKITTEQFTKSDSVDSYVKVDDIKIAIKQPSIDAYEKVDGIIPPPPAPRKVRDSTEKAKLTTDPDLDYEVARAPTPLLSTSPNQSYGLFESSLEIPTVKSMIKSIDTNRDCEVARSPSTNLRTSPNQSYGLIERTLGPRSPSPNPRTSTNHSHGLVDQAKNSLGLRAQKARSSLELPTAWIIKSPNTNQDCEIVRSLSPNLRTSTSNSSLVDQAKGSLGLSMKKAKSSSELPTGKSTPKAMEADKDYEVPRAPTPHLKTTPNKSYGIIYRARSSSELPILKTTNSIDDYEPVEKPASVIQKEKLKS